MGKFIGDGGKQAEDWRGTKNTITEVITSIDRQNEKYFLLAHCYFMYRRILNGSESK